MLRVPHNTRRLTRAEAKRLGVSYGAKRQVRTGVKVTSATKLYTNRQVATAKIKAKTKGKFVTKEHFTKGRVEFRTIKASGGVIVEYKDLTKPALFKKLRKHRYNDVMVKFSGSDGKRGAMYKGRDIGEEDWYSADARISADELLDEENWVMFLEDNEVSGDLRFGLIVYP